MLIQWCIQCKSVPFWMSEGFHSRAGANLAGSGGTCWRCQGLAGVIDALWWCPTITLEMTAAACVTPDRKEHLPTMARFHRPSCLFFFVRMQLTAAKEKRNRSCGKTCLCAQCRAAMPCRFRWCKSDLLRSRFRWRRKEEGGRWCGWFRTTTWHNWA